MDTKTHPMVAFHVGDRSRASTKALWVNLPEVDPQPATFHTAQEIQDIHMSSTTNVQITSVIVGITIPHLLDSS